MTFKGLFVTAATVLMSANAMAVEAGDEAPAWSGLNENGAEINFPAMLDGKPTIMVFWATWCPYCKAFMPFLEQIQKDYGEEKINVLMVNHKERGEGDPVEYTNSLTFPVTSIMAGDAIGDAYTIDFIPGLLIIDPDGTVAWRRESTDLPAGREVGEFWNMKVREQLDTML